MGQFFSLHLLTGLHCHFSKAHPFVPGPAQSPCQSLCWHRWLKPSSRPAWPCSCKLPQQTTSAVQADSFLTGRKQAFKIQWQQSHKSNILGAGCGRWRPTHDPISKLPIQKTLHCKVLFHKVFNCLRSLTGNRRSSDSCRMVLKKHNHFICWHGVVFCLCHWIKLQVAVFLFIYFYLIFFFFCRLSLNAGTLIFIMYIWKSAVWTINILTASRWNGAVFLNLGPYILGVTCHFNLLFFPLPATHVLQLKVTRKTGKGTAADEAAENETTATLPVYHKGAALSPCVRYWYPTDALDCTVYTYSICKCIYR